MSSTTWKAIHLIWFDWMSERHFDQCDAISQPLNLLAADVATVMTNDYQYVHDLKGFADAMLPGVVPFMLLCARARIAELRGFFATAELLVCNVRSGRSFCVCLCTFWRCMPITDSSATQLRLLEYSMRTYVKCRTNEMYQICIQLHSQVVAGSSHSLHWSPFASGPSIP